MFDAQKWAKQNTPAAEEWPEEEVTPAVVVMPETNGRAPPEKTEEPWEPVLTPMSQIARRPVTWLWQNWLPEGCLAILDGDPGLAKSTLTLDLAARVSRGWGMPPDGGGKVVREPAGVVLLSDEDDPESTIGPRLDLAGADCDRVILFGSMARQGEKRPVVLPFDLELATERIRASSTRLVIVDPFFAFLDDQYDGHKDQEVRKALRRLGLLARELHLTVLVIRHLNKLNGGASLYRGGGSIGIIGAARAAWIVGTDPDDATTHILAMNKLNLGPHPTSLAYRLETEGSCSRIAWKGETELMAADILGHPSGRGRPPKEVQEAISFLQKLLADGPREVGEITREADSAGITKRSLDRAKSAAGVTSRKIGLQGGWVWELVKK